VQFLARQIKHPQKAALLEDDSVGAFGAHAQARKIDVVIGEMGDFAELLGGEIIHPDIAAMLRVAVGKVIDFAANPHGRGVGRLSERDLDELLRRKIIGVDFLRQAAGVTFPGSEIAEDAIIGDRFPVGTERQKAAAIERQRLGEAAGHRHGEQPPVPAVPRHAPRQENDALRIRRPGHDHVVGTPARRSLVDHVGMKRQALSRPAAGRHHVNVLISLVAAGEGDAAAVGGEARHQIVTRLRCQSICRPAPPRHLPEIAVGFEHHPIAVQRGKPHQRALSGAPLVTSHPRQAHANERGPEPTTNLHNSPHCGACTSVIYRKEVRATKGGF
jgi:hypothetical protein